MKDPAFLFYPNDFMGGTMGMTFEEKGAYIELLILQFNRGHMTTHMIGHMLGQSMDKIWPALKDKFEEDESGSFFNPRLEEEKVKRRAYSESRRNNIKGVNQHTKKKNKVGHMTSHMEDENEDVNIDKNRNKKRVARKKTKLIKPLQERQKIFQETIRSEVGKRIAREDANDFYRHWAAVIQGTDIMLWEDQKTWSLNLRIATWIKKKTEFALEAESKQNLRKDREVSGKRSKAVQSVADISKDLRQ